MAYVCRRDGGARSLHALITLLASQSRLRLISAAVVLVAVTGVGDYATGSDMTFSVVYLVPVVLAAVAARRAGVATSAAAAVAWTVIQMALRPAPYANAWVPLWNVLARFSVLALTALLVSSLAMMLADESRLSRTDSLTRLLNTRGFQEAADLEIYWMARTGQPLTVAYIDIDHFKAVNDRHGHAAGDNVLDVVAHTMTALLRKTDRIARLGGDEFAILLPTTRVHDAQTVLDRLHANLHAATASYGYGIGFSIGAMAFTEPPTSAQELVMRADQLMYKVKHNGKNTVLCEPASPWRAPASPAS